MTTTVTVISDNKKEGDLLAESIARMARNDGFRHVHLNNVNVESKKGKSLLSVIRETHDPDFLKTEQVFITSVDASKEKIDSVTTVRKSGGLTSWDKISFPEKEPQIEMKRSVKMMDAIYDYVEGTGNIIPERFLGKFFSAVEADEVEVQTLANRLSNDVADELVLDDPLEPDVKAVVLRAREIADKDGDKVMDIQKAQKQLESEGVLNRFNAPLAGLGATIVALKELTTGREYDDGTMSKPNPDLQQLYSDMHVGSDEDQKEYEYNVGL